MKVKLLLCMMVLGLLGTAAQQSAPEIINGTVCYLSKSKDITFKTVKPNEDITKAPNLAAKPKAGAATHEVNFVLDFDETYQIPHQIFLRNSEYAMPIYDEFVKGSNTYAIPAGVYDIFVEFGTQVEPIVSLLVFRELVRIDHDTTLNISASEAKNHVHFEMLNMDGTPFDTDNYTKDDNGQWILTKQGNCDGIIYANKIFCEDYGSLVITNDFIGNADAEYDVYARNNSDYYVNDLSSRWALYSYRAAIKGREVYTSALETQGVNDDITLTNDPSKYMLFEDPFIAPKYQSEDLFQTFQMYPRVDKDWIIYSNSYSIQNPMPHGETCKYYIGASVEDSKAGYIPLLEPQISVKIVDEDGWEEYLPVLKSNPLTMTCGQAIFANNGIGDGGDYVFTKFGYLFSEELNEIYVEPYWPTHPVFSYSVDKKLDRLYNSCPILVANLKQYDLSEDSYYMAYENAYVGRYDETKPNDVADAAVNIKLNGEEIIAYQGPFSAEISPLPIGEVDATIINDTFQVDDLSGSNKAELHYTIGSEDEAPPTLTMLDFKAENGDVTQNFNTAEEGTLEFSAGDFNFIISPMGYQGYKTKPLESVEVSYSPYGEDNWNELAVEEVPENYWPVMGWFYTGSLAGVTGEALNGWFDLKIRLTDAAGNWQEQVLSPAFRIDDLAYSSVANVGKDNAREVARYSIDGQRVDANHRGVAIVKMSDGTARKVIVR